MMIAATHDDSAKRRVARAFRCVMLSATALLLQACASRVALPNADQPIPVTKTDAIAQWNGILNDFVDEKGYVDFHSLAQNKLGLELYILYVARTPLSAFNDGTSRLAHLINSYNAMSMYNVIDLGIPQSNASLLARYNFFIRRKFVIGGETMSLYDYENKVIRAVGDSRIHWALNCSAVSCPSLPRKAFSETNLDAELDTEARKFFSQSRNLRVNHELREAWISEIFVLFPEDFVPKHGANYIDYINRYVNPPIPRDYRIRIIPYDWTIADSHRRK
jgi:Protein of unknown function, DUF547